MATRDSHSGQPHPLYQALELRALFEMALLPWSAPLLAHAPRGDVHPVLLLPSLLVGAADAVAEQGYCACLRGDVIVVPGAVSRAAALAAGATPKWLLRRAAGAVGRKVF